MSHSKKAKIASTSGGPFAKRPREMLVWILQMFSMHEVASLQRLVSREFRDAGQERIRERGGRKLFEEAMVYFHGLDYKTINKPRARLLLRASRDAGCKTMLVRLRMNAPNLSNQDKQKILKDLKEIATSSPYHWVDFYISEWYRRGFGGEEKKNQAVAWLERAVHKGNTHAMCNLGYFYDKGELGLTQSHTKANEVWALAAKKGHAQARCNLGNCYREGRGDLAIDFNRCVELWDQSAKQGYVDAQVNLEHIYRLGSQDGEIDLEKAMHWFQKSAAQGHQRAMDAVARLS